MADGNVVRAEAQLEVMRLVTAARERHISVPVEVARDACWRTEDDDLRDAIVDQALYWVHATRGPIGGELKARAGLLEAASALYQARS